MAKDTKLPSLELIEELNYTVEDLEFDKLCLLEVSIQRVICSYEVGMVRTGSDLKDRKLPIALLMKNWFTTQLRK